MIFLFFASVLIFHVLHYYSWLSFIRNLCWSSSLRVCLLQLSSVFVPMSSSFFLVKPFPFEVYFCYRSKFVIKCLLPLFLNCYLFFFFYRDSQRFMIYGNFPVNFSKSSIQLYIFLKKRHVLILNISRI